MKKIKMTRTGEMHRPELVRNLERGEMSGAGIRRAGSNLVWRGDGNSYPSFRVKLYRFLRESIPVLSGAIWTWSLFPRRHPNMK